MTCIVEAGVNIKVVQEVVGHKDVQVTLNIYTDVTKDLKKKEFKELNQKWKENIAGVEPE